MWSDPRPRSRWRGEASRSPLLEAEPEPGLAASGTNSGILHTGFDSTPGELETELILRAAELRDPVLGALGVPVLRCGALMRPVGEGDEVAIAHLTANAHRNGVEVVLGDDGLEVPGESVTDPVAYTLALAAAARAPRRRASHRLSRRCAGCESRPGITLSQAGGEPLVARLVVNCAGLGADRVARLAGDDSFEIYPRKGEFLVFDPPAGEPLERILLPVPDERTKGVLVFPTVDGKVIAGPTAVDLRDPRTGRCGRRPARRSSRRRRRCIRRSTERSPSSPTPGCGRPVAAAQLPDRPLAPPVPALVNVAAIRSTGLTASLAIASASPSSSPTRGRAHRPGAARTRVARAPPGPWWRRTADHRAGRVAEDMTR